MDYFEAAETKRKENNVFRPEQWIGRRFKCKATGEILVLTEENVRPRAFLEFGECFIDLGDGYYSRGGGIFEEIED